MSLYSVKLTASGSIAGIGSFPNSTAQLSDHAHIAVLRLTGGSYTQSARPPRALAVHVVWTKVTGELPEGKTSLPAGNTEKEMSRVRDYQDIIICI